MFSNSTPKSVNFWDPVRELWSPRRSRGSKFFAILVLKNLLIVRSFGWVFRVLAIFHVFFEGELREESNQKHATTQSSYAEVGRLGKKAPVCRILTFLARGGRAIFIEKTRFSQCSYLRPFFRCFLKHRSFIK